MFTTPAPAAPTVSATPVNTTSPPSARASGLRGGLSLLRDYTHGLYSAHSAGTAGGPREHSRASTSQTAKNTRRPRTSSSSTPPISPSSPASSDSNSRVTISGRGSLQRTHTAPEAEAEHQSPSAAAAAAAAAAAEPSTNTMTRNRADTAAPQLSVRNQAGPTPATPTSPLNMDVTDANGDSTAAVRNLPSIRFIPHQDPRAGRPSLQFPTVTRTLPNESAVIRVGRYSERDNIPDIPPNVPSAAAIGFKSKVVSRKHCELWCKDGSWYIKDVKSSSGTFLNHIRLSQPNVESKPFPIKDGDIIQLGIDFRGGEEMIFRCVKIRIECNRGWQQSLNTFNKQTHQRLRNLAKTKKESDSASTHTSECSICLMSIAPCQSLFVAPCSHVWHYKCIRPILNGPTWPNFLCPNCRAVADLEADAEDPGEFEEWEGGDAEKNGDSNGNGEDAREDRHVTPRASQVGPLNEGGEASNATQTNGQLFDDLSSAMSNINIADSLNGIANQPVTGDPETPQRFITPPTASSSVTQPVAINVSSANASAGFSPLFQTDSSSALSPGDRPQDCPMTPRNDAGPFVLDGSAGRAAGERFREGENASNSNGTSAPSLPPLNMN